MHISVFQRSTGKYGDANPITLEYSDLFGYKSAILTVNATHDETKEEEMITFVFSGDVDRDAGN